MPRPTQQPGQSGWKKRVNFTGSLVASSVDNSVDPSVINNNVLGSSCNDRAEYSMKMFVEMLF